MTQHEIWVSPNNVRHYVLVIQDNGPIVPPRVASCVTCGKMHNVLHFRNVRVYDTNMRVHGPCSIQVIGWPYECLAKDRNPDHVVYQCETHGVWWHEAP